jgi:hypothetical protein
MYPWIAFGVLSTVSPFFALYGYNIPFGKLLCVVFFALALASALYLTKTYRAKAWLIAGIWIVFLATEIPFLGGFWMAMTFRGG